MADKKDIALTVLGILASIAVAYFVYRAESQNNAANDAAQQDAAAQAELDDEAQEAQQQSFLASLASSVSSGGGATSWTGTGNSTSTDTTASSITDESAAAGDGFSLSSLLSQYESAIQSTQQTGSGQTVATINPTVESFDAPSVQSGYADGSAPILTSVGSSVLNSIAGAPPVGQTGGEVTSGKNGLDTNVAVASYPGLMSAVS